MRRTASLLLACRSLCSEGPQVPAVWSCSLVAIWILGWRVWVGCLCGFGLIIGKACATAHASRGCVHFLKVESTSLWKFLGRQDGALNLNPEHYIPGPDPALPYLAARSPTDRRHQAQQWRCPAQALGVQDCYYHYFGVATTVSLTSRTNLCHDYRCKY